MRTSRTNVSPSIHITQTLLLIISSLIWYKFLLYSPQRLPRRWNKLDCFFSHDPTTSACCSCPQRESRTGRAAQARQAQWAPGRMPEAQRMRSKSGLGYSQRPGSPEWQCLAASSLCSLLQEVLLTGYTILPKLTNISFYSHNQTLIFFLLSIIDSSSA